MWVGDTCLQGSDGIGCVEIKNGIPNKTKNRSVAVLEMALEPERLISNARPETNVPQDSNTIENMLSTDCVQGLLAAPFHTCGLSVLGVRPIPHGL